jgi:hypothetical protein
MILQRQKDTMSEGNRSVSFTVISPALGQYLMLYRHLIDIIYLITLPVLISYILFALDKSSG